MRKHERGDSKKRIHRRDHCRRRLERICLPVFAVKHIAVHGIPETEVEEKGNEKRKRENVEQLNGEVEILSRIKRRVGVEHERGKTDRCEMENERRTAPLLEQHKKPDPEPHQPDQGQ